MAVPQYWHFALIQRLFTLRLTLVTVMKFYKLLKNMSSYTVNAKSSICLRTSIFANMIRQQEGSAGAHVICHLFVKVDSCLLSHRSEQAPLENTQTEHSTLQQTSPREHTDGAFQPTVAHRRAVQPTNKMSKMDQPPPKNTQTEYSSSL